MTCFLSLYKYISDMYQNNILLHLEKLFNILRTCYAWAACVYKPTSILNNCYVNEFENNNQKYLFAFYFNTDDFELSFANFRKGTKSQRLLPCVNQWLETLLFILLTASLEYLSFVFLEATRFPRNSSFECLGNSFRAEIHLPILI